MPSLPIDGLAWQNPGTLGLATAVGALLLALVVGWTVGATVGRRLDARLSARHPLLVGRFAGRIARMLRRTVEVVLLLVAFETHRAGPIGDLVIASAIGLVAGSLAYEAARGLGAGRGASTAVGLAALVAAAGGLLGGLDPLTVALDRAALSIGSTRVSLLDVVNAALVGVVLFAVTRVAVRVATRSIARTRDLDPSQRVLFQKLANLGIVALAVLVGIDLIGVDLTSLAVFSGALGLAVGFGLQKTFGNLIAGLILLMDRSIKPGDVIVVGDTFGWVNKIGVRSVSVLTRDGKEHLIPNEKLMTEPVENWSYSDRNVRVHIPIRVSYGSDLRRAQALMIEAASENPRVLDDPAPVSWIVEFGDSAVKFDMRLWIDDPEKGISNVMGEVMMRVYDLFGENGIEFPFPQRDVHIRSLPEVPRD